MSNFSPAKRLYDESREPCFRYRGCPYGGTVPKDIPVAFCGDCMEEMHYTRGRYKARTLQEVKAASDRAGERFNQHAYLQDKSLINWRLSPYVA